MRRTGKILALASTMLFAGCMMDGTMEGADDVADSESEFDDGWAASGNGTDVDSKASWVSPWFSEESGGHVCPVGQGIYRVECRGSYCDDMRIFCSDSGDAYLGKSSYWTSYFSEEQGGGACASGYVATGMWCRGRNCDDISLECTDIIYNSTGHCTSTQWFSEEGAGYGSMPTSYYRVYRVSCRGKYCDDKQLHGCNYDL